MAEILEFSDIENNFFQNKKNFVVIGFFDGVHKGHQNIIKKCVNSALKAGTVSTALTFYKPPANILEGKKLKKLIIPFEQKIKLISKLGVNYIVNVNFDHKFASLTPEEFCNEILLKKLNSDEIFIGENFRFGKNASGDDNYLKEFFKDKGKKVNVLKLLKIGDTIISSTNIREFFAKGDIDRICQFLGRPPEISGEICSGFKRGREIGFPTANIEIDDDFVVPCKGVYAGKIRIDDKGKFLSAVINIGNNPTFGFRNTIVEIHILDFNKNIYGKKLLVRFLKFIRSEEKFDELDDLVKKINSDILFAKKLFKLNS